MKLYINKFYILNKGLNMILTVSEIVNSVYFWKFCVLEYSMCYFT